MDLTDPLTRKMIETTGVVTLVEAELLLSVVDRKMADDQIAQLARGRGWATWDEMAEWFVNELPKAHLPIDVRMPNRRRFEAVMEESR